MIGRRAISLCVAVVVIALVAAGVARGVSGGGSAPVVEFSTGTNVSTPSGQFLTIASKTFTANAGPILVRFNANGYVADFGSGGTFVGQSYAALRVRVVIGTTVLSPGIVRFFDNTGKIAIQSPRPLANSFEWAATLGTSGSKTVRVQVANLNAFDMAQISAWSLAVQHG
jgi:hypothetical protein